MFGKYIDLNACSKKIKQFYYTVFLQLVIDVGMMG
jgi:hypothetical protein